MPQQKKTPKTKRRTGFTRISVNLPDGLLVDLDAAAAADNRTRNNFLTHMIRCMLARGQVSQGLVLRDLPDDAC